MPEPLERKCEIWTWNGKTKYTIYEWSPVFNGEYGWRQIQVTYNEEEAKQLLAERNKMFYGEIGEITSSLEDRLNGLR